MTPVASWLAQIASWLLNGVQQIGFDLKSQKLTQHFPCERLL